MSVIPESPIEIAPQYNVVVSISPEQDVQRCFLGRVAIQQGLGPDWERVPTHIQETDIDPHFDELETFFDQDARRKASVPYDQFENAYSTLQQLREGMTREEIMAESNIPGNTHAHQLNGLQRTLNALMIGTNYRPGLVQKDAEPQPRRETNFLSLRRALGEINCKEPYASIVLARSEGWSDSEIITAFGLLRPRANSDYYNPSRVVAREVPRLRKHLGNDPALLRVFTETEERHKQLPPSIIKEAERRRSGDVSGFLDQYLANVSYCQTVLTPSLRSSSGYEGSLPLAEIQRSCLQSPDHYKDSVKKWFTGSLEVIQKLQSAGKPCVEPIVSQYLVTNYKKIAADLETIGSELQESNQPPCNREGLEAIRTALVHGDIKSKMGHRSWQAAVLQYAVRRFAEMDETERAETDIERAVLYVDAHLPTYNKQAEEQLPTDWRSQAGIALAYIDDVHHMQKLGHTNAYGAARSQDPNILKTLYNEYGRRELSRGVIRSACDRAPLTPRKQLDGLLAEREEIIRIAGEKEFALDIDTATYMAMRRPHNAPSKVHDFLEAYGPLVEKHTDTLYFEEWMAARAIIRYPSNADRGVASYVKMARDGFFSTSSVGVTTKGRGNVAAEFELLDTVDVLRTASRLVEENTQAQEFVATMLATITEAEAAAISIVYGLNGSEAHDEQQIAAELGVKDLDEYVRTVVLPKMKSPRS